MQIGDTVTERVKCLDSIEKGKVVYIHPENRYYTVEFKGLFGSFRESFWFPLVPINEQPDKEREGFHYLKKENVKNW